MLSLATLFGVSLSCALLAAGQTPASADLILHGGRVLTLVEPEPEPAPTAVAIAGDRIFAVGADATVLQTRGETTQQIDLQGAVVIPGFIDGHAHLYGLGKALAEIDLVGTASAAAVVELVAEAAVQLPDLEWLQGRGWDQNDWAVTEYPDRSLLDAAIADRPVLLRRVDGHAAWANSAALRRAGIDASTPDPDGGAILRDANGEPTGILIDNGVDLVRDIIPKVADQEVRRRIGLAVEHCLRHGITGVHDAGVSWQRVQLYREMADRQELGLRLYVMLENTPETLVPGYIEGPLITENRMLTVRAVKLYADGALGSRGASLLKPYTDEPDNRGLMVTPGGQLREVMEQAGYAGFQVCTHAIGDRANRTVLNLYEQVLPTVRTSNDMRWRIEHAQIIDPKDLPRFARLGVIAAMQPVHCTSDMAWVEERLGPTRLAGAYAWRSLADSGTRLCFGTDFPVEDVDPLHGLYAARTRMTHEGTPAGGWFPEQCLDGRAALAAYTAGPAYAAFQEADLGSVQPGKLADLTVLSVDPTNCPPAELLSAQTLLTIVAGVIRHDAR